jgi:hypothetical protein
VCSGEGQIVHVTSALAAMLGRTVPQVRQPRLESCQCGRLSRTELHTHFTPLTALSLRSLPTDLTMRWKACWWSRSPSCTASIRYASTLAFMWSRARKRASCVPCRSQSIPPTAAPPYSCRSGLSVLLAAMTPQGRKASEPKDSHSALAVGERVVEADRRAPTVCAAGRHTVPPGHEAPPRG